MAVVVGQGDRSSDGKSGGIQCIFWEEWTDLTMMVWGIHADIKTEAMFLAWATGCVVVSFTQVEKKGGEMGL